MKYLVIILLLGGLVSCGDGWVVDESNPRELEMHRLNNDFGDTVYIVSDEIARTRYFLKEHYETDNYNKADSVFNAWLRRDILEYKKLMKDYQKIK